MTSNASLLNLKRGMVLLFLLLGGVVFSQSLKINVDSHAYLSVKSDIAHCFIKMKVTGKDYDAIQGDINEKIAFVKKAALDEFKEKVDVKVVSESVRYEMERSTTFFGLRVRLISKKRRKGSPSPIAP